MAIAIRTKPGTRTRSRRRTVVGLDIEPGRIVAAQVSLNGTVQLERAASAELQLGVVRAGEVGDAKGVSAALRRLCAEHKGLGRQVRVGVANAKIVVRSVEIPPLTDAAQIEASARPPPAAAPPVRLAR